MVSTKLTTIFLYSKLCFIVQFFSETFLYKKVIIIIWFKLMNGYISHTLLVNRNYSYSLVASNESCENPFEDEFKRNHNRIDFNLYCNIAMN